MAISIIEIDGTAFPLGASASNVAFDNTGTEIDAGTVQGAIEAVKLRAGNNITIVDGVISATGGGGGGSQDVSGKADLLANSGMLTPSQWPKVVLRNVADTMLDDLVSGDIYYDSGYLFLQTNGDPVSLGRPNPKTIYFCLADGAFYRWHGSGWTLIGGGGDYSLSKVITNIDTLQAKIDEVIGKLANSSFSVSPKPAVIGEFDWGGGGGETTTYYNISISTSMKYTMSNTATTIEAGQTYTNVIEANAGYDLTSVLVNGVAQTITNNRCTINIVNVSADITVTITAEQQSVDPGTTYGVSVTATDLDVTPNGGTVLEGGTFQCTLALATGVTGKRLPRLDEITISGTHGTATLSNAVLTIPNIQSNITIVASAIATSGVSHSVTYNLSGANKTSGDDSVDDGTSLTAVLAKDSSTWPSGEQGGEIAPAQEAFLARDIIVYMGGIPLVKGTDYSVSQSSPNAAVTVIVNNVTADVLIANIVWTAERINSTHNGMVQTGSDYVARYRASSLVPIPNECTEMSVVDNNDKTYGTTNSQLGVCFYDENEDFVGYENSKGHQVLTFEVPSSAKYVRMAGNNWYQSKDSNGYGTGGSNTNGIDYAFYIYDDTNERFVWKGLYVTETINTDNAPT